MDVEVPRALLSVLVVDNHEAARAGVVARLRQSPAQFEIWGECADLVDLDLTSKPPDLVVLDLYLGRDDTLSSGWIPDLRVWGATVVLHTSEERPAPLCEAVHHGAAGLALKNDTLDKLKDVLLVAAGGDFACTSRLAEALLDQRAVAQLTTREIQVLELLDDGFSRAQVAKRLKVSVNTVDSHMKNVRQKYLDLDRDVTNSISIVREANRDGWLRRLFGRPKDR